MQWRKAESAPKDGEEFLGTCGRFVYVCWWDHSLEEFVWAENESTVHITHWQRLPRLPEGE
jgi:hypothetical protein